MAATDNGARTSLASMLEDLLGTNLDRDPSLRRKPPRAARGRSAGHGRRAVARRATAARHRARRARRRRAYVAGELDLEGDIFTVLALQDRLEDLKVSPAQVLGALRILGLRELKPLAPPPEEARLHGRRHSKERDAAAIAHHYDVSNDFYRIVLGPSMTYSCAVWTEATTTLEDAQADKHELVCTKLGLEPGMRLLDIGCGWGGMILHAAEHHGVRAVGVTLSQHQADLAEKRIAEAGLADRVEVRCGLPRPRRRAVRRDQLDRDVRARRVDGARRLLRPLRGAPRTRRPVAQPRDQRAPPPRVSNPVARVSSSCGSGSGVGSATTSSTATSSRTASCTKPVRWSRRSSGRGSRSATSRASASTTRSRSGAGYANLEDGWDAAVAEPGEAAAPGSGASTWRSPRSASSRTAPRSTRCSR